MGSSRVHRSNRRQISVAQFIDDVLSNWPRINMDATHTPFFKNALLLTVALLSTAPFASAVGTLSATPTSLTMSSTTGAVANADINLTNSSSDPIDVTITATYDSPATGWLNLPISGQVPLPIIGNV